MSQISRLSSWSAPDEPDQKSECFEVQQGDVLESSTSRYLVNRFLGSGYFGKVARTVNLTTAEDVALKILKTKESKDSKREMEMLRVVSGCDPVKANVVHCYDMFEHKGLTCLAFELLDRSLFQLMVDRGGEPLSLPELRPIAQQLLSALDALKGIGVIHADLKPDNIMLVNHQDQPFRVKLIDFGLSLRTSEVKDGMWIQVNTYRAPEVFLGLPFTEAVDMWALGCVLAMLFMSTDLFGSACDYQVMRNIVEIVGQPPDRLLSAGKLTQQFFTQRQYLEPKWWLKTPAEYHLDRGIEPRLCRRFLNSLQDLMLVNIRVEEVIEIEDRRAFISFMTGLLDIDPEQRIRPEKALKHPFVSMVHLEEERDTSVYVTGSYDKMTVIVEDPSPAAESASPDNILTPSDEAADGSIKQDPAEEEIQDSDGSPAEGVPKKERQSRLKRIKRFFTRAIRRVFGLRRNSDGQH